MNLVVASLAAQVPRGIVLLDVADPAPTLPVDAVWPAQHPQPAVGRFLDSAAVLGREHGRL